MKKLILLIGAFATAPLLLTAVADAGAKSQPPAHSIIGAWQVEVTVRQNAADCSTAPEAPGGPNPFPSLNTFHKGGTVSETGSRSPPSMRSPGHGVWKRIGGDRFEFRVTFQRFDVNGLLTSNMEIRSEFALAPDGNTFEGVGRLLVTDLSGNSFTFCATQSGVRFSL